MVKLRRDMQRVLSDTSSLRLRAAWLYYNQEMAQKDIAEQLNVSRTTVIRMLDEALKRREVQFWISEGEGECVELALRLERIFGLDEAVVVPVQGSADVVAKGVGFALGQFLSEAIPDDCVIGVGWGRTLNASLESFRPARRRNVKIVSLLGGLIETRFFSPLDYSWRLASQLDAECFLFPSPLVVDSTETKQRLIERCGLDRLYELAETLDIAIVSTGDIGQQGSSISGEILTEGELGEILDLGCVCDVLCHFLDAEGRTVPHPINDRVMSVDLESLSKARHIVLASGGRHRARAILAALRRIGCHTLVTDEGAAHELLRLAENTSAGSGS